MCWAARRPMCKFPLVDPVVADARISLIRTRIRDAICAAECEAAFSAPSVYFQVSAFVLIYTIGDITSEAKLRWSHEQIRRIGAAES